VFKCTKREEADSWKDEISRHIDNSLGKKYDKTAENVAKPWRFDNISEEQFIKEADTGDVLLYKTRNAGGGIIRKFTSSEFDHVAMVLKFDLD